MQEPNDPVIDEVREIRRAISARFDHDPARLVAHDMELQQRHRGRIIERSNPETDREKRGREPVEGSGVPGSSFRPAE